MLFWVRFSIAAVLLLLFGVAAIGNIILALDARFRGKRHSLAPFLGGAAGAVGAMVSPYPLLQAYWWVPLVADIGTVPLLAVTLVWVLAGGPRKAKM